MLTILNNNARLPPHEDGAEHNGLIFFGMPPTPFTILDNIVHAGEDLRYLGGHMGWKDVQIIQDYTPNLRFKPFTILREPKERLVSFWAYLNEIGNNHTLPQMMRGMLRNSMYRMLAPLGSDLKDTEATMASIKKTLKKEFSVVGLTERFDETLMLLTQKGIIRDPSYSKHKVLAGSRPRYADLPEDIQKMLEKHNSLDLELYAWAQEFFNEQIQSADSDFQQRLETFQEEQRSRQEQSGNDGDCEDDLPRFGGWSCEKEKRSERESPRERIKKELEDMDRTEKVLYHVQQMEKPRYW